MEGMSKGYKDWGNNNIYPSAKIGEGCNIAKWVEVGKDVVIGKNCKIGCGAFIPEGVTLEDEVFIGPNAVMTNDLHPRATGSWELKRTLIKKGASIGANATIVCGVTVGAGAMIGAGAVITHNIPDGETWVGNPSFKLR